MLKIEGQLGRRGITCLRIVFQPPQDDFVQPGRHGGSPGPRRNGIAPQSPAPVIHSLGFAKRAVAGCEKIQNDSEREQIAARIAAHTENLLGRNISARSDRSLGFLLHQVRQLVVPRETEIDQHRVFPTQDHIARLEIEMDDMLAMDVVQGKGDLGASIAATSFGTSGTLARSDFTDAPAINSITMYGRSKSPVAMKRGV